LKGEMMEKLLNCPFCGSEAKLINRADMPFDNTAYFDVACVAKGCFLSQGADWHLETPDKIINLWNNRKKK